MRAARLFVTRLVVLLAALAFTTPARAGSCVGAACVVAGPRLLTVDSAQSALLNPLLQGLLGGGNVTLVAADWNAIAQTDVRLTTVLNLLQARTGAGSVQGALNTDVTVLTLLDVAAQAAEADGATAAGAALRALALNVGGLSGTLRLGDLLQLDFPPGAFTDSRINLLNLVLGSAQLFNTRNAVTTTTPIALSGVAVNLSGLGLGVNTVTPTVQAFVQVIEPPVYRCGPQGATFHTASVRVKLNVDLGNLNVNLLNTAGVDMGLDLRLTSLTAYLEVARASGAIGLVDALADAVTLNVTPGVARLALGTIDDAVFFNRNVPDPFSTLTPARIGTTQVNVVGLGLLNVDVNARGLADGTPGATAATFAGPYPQTQVVQSGFAGVTSLVTSLLETLSVSLSVSAGQNVPPLVQGTVNATLANLLAPVTTTLRLALRPVLVSTLTALGDQVLRLVGTGIGQATVTVTGVTSACWVTGRVYRDLQPNGVPDVGEVWPGPTVLVQAVRDGVVVASVAVPAGAGTYSLVVPEGQLTLPLTTVPGGLSPVPPPGSVFVTPPDGQVSLTVAAGATSVPEVNFGLFSGDRVQGVLFRDDGRGGGVAHDVLRQAAEGSLGGVMVAVSGSGGTRVSTTDAAGAFTLFVPGDWIAVTLDPGAPQPGLEALTGVRIGTAVTAATDPQGTGLRPIPLPAPTGQNRTVLVGATGRPTLTPDGAQRSEAPATLVYPHTFRPGTTGTGTFTTGGGLPATVAVDSNCDGTLSAAERAAGSVLTVDDRWPRDADGRLSACALDVTVNLPAATPPGTVNSTPVTLTIQWINSAVVDATSAADTTTVIPGARVTKTGQNLTQGGAARLDVEAQPGDRVRYCLEVTNTTPDALSALILRDTLQGAAVYVPGSLTLAGVPLTDAADGDAGEITGRTVTYRVAGLAANASAVACLDVLIP